MDHDNKAGLTEDARPTWRINTEIFAIGLGALMAALAQTLVLPVLPVISRDLGASAAQTQWLLTSTLLVGAASVPVVSRLADMFGRRRMLVVALGALAAGSIVASATDNIAVTIAGRALTGLSGAAIPLGISLLVAVLPAARKGSGVALVSAMLGIGGTLGLPLSGLIADNIDYRFVYWIGAIGAALSIGLITFFVGKPPNAVRGPIDLKGALLLVGGLVALILPLSQGSTWGWSAVPTACLFAASVILLGLLVVVELRTRNPLIDMRALANPPVVITNVASVFIGFALFASFVGTSNYVQAPESAGYGFDASVLTAGLCLLPSGLLMLILVPVAARLIQGWGAGYVLACGGSLITAGMVVRIFATESLWQIVLGSTIVGAGTGLAYACLPSLINAHTPAADLAAANGINSLARSLGSTIASAVGGSLLASITVTVGGTALPSLDAYRVLFVTTAVASIAAALAGLVVTSPKFAPLVRGRELDSVS